VRVAKALKVMPMLALAVSSVPPTMKGRRSDSISRSASTGARSCSMCVGQHGELVAAQPRHHVARAQLLLDAPRHLAQEARRRRCGPGCR
jgi:hypothetical protein